MKTLIRNASIYRAEIPLEGIDLSMALESQQFTELLASQEFGCGFVKHDAQAGGDFLRPFTGGYAMLVRLDQKVIPSSALKDEVKRQIAKIRELEGREPGRKETREIKEEARMTLALKALIRTSYVPVYYHVSSKTLIIATTANNACDRITTMLVRAVDALKTSTIHVSVRSGLTTRLSQWLSSGGEDGFGDLEPVGRAVLVSAADKRTVSVKAETLMSNEDALKEALKHGYEVKQLGLKLQDTSFLLSDKFKFSSIETLIDAEEAGEDALVWESVALIEVQGLVNVINAMCAMLGYEEKEGA